VRLFGALLAGSAAVAAFALVLGVELKRTDSENFPHEYRLFWKSSPSVQWAFVNPAYRYFELSSFASLDVDRKGATNRFCEVVYGTTDPLLCYARMEPFYGKPVDRTKR
jgi:hypothetical protein